MGSGVFFQFRTVYRFIAASTAGFLAFLIFIMSRSSSGFYAILQDMAEMLSNTVLSVEGGDAVRNSFLSEVLSPDNIAQMSRNILLSGGITASMFFLFFINRQIAYSLVLFIKKQRRDSGLIGFFVPANTIWVLSLSLVLILLTRFMKAEIPQIIAWNIFVICAILFLAQGAGIVLFLLERRAPAFRLFINVLIIVLVFSPLNMAVLAACILLGIAENWFAFRLPKQSVE
jgi:hypothetical protein